MDRIELLKKANMRLKTRQRVRKWAIIKAVQQARSGRAAFRACPSLQVRIQAEPSEESGRG